MSIIFLPLTMRNRLVLLLHRPLDDHLIPFFCHHRHRRRHPKTADEFKCACLCRKTERTTIM